MNRSESETAFVLHFDMTRKLRKRFAEFHREAAAQAEQSSRTAEQMRGYEAWGRNHPDAEGPKRA